jgi:4-amino-4-deoxy-L-arabinose transferase-like glycosyltransferase
MMPVERLTPLRLLCLTLLAAAILWPGLGSSGRLSYHEAFVAQGAREMLASGSWWNPTIGRLPWLEKPPLPWWLVASVGSLTGNVDEIAARFPTTLAAIGLVLGVAVLATRHYGQMIGLLAGAIQATTAWTAMRGRLAEADMLLACLITWALVAFDSLSASNADRSGQTPNPARSHRLTQWAFFTLLGATSLVKGIGFGAVLILAVVATSIVANRDRTTARLLCFLPGWIWALVLALTWPVAMLIIHGLGALSLWTLHVADRLATRPGAFAGEPWWEYIPGILAQALPWTPLAVVGAWSSLGRAIGRPSRSSHIVALPRAVITGDRLLWAWAFAPVAVLSVATVKNAHYVISAQVPWSVWAAMGLSTLATRLSRRGWSHHSLTRTAQIGFCGLAFTYGLGFWLLGPWFDRRGVEWGFYELAAQQLPADAPLALLYDDWDRNPYESSFGAIPHDLAVRLFYLGRSASWHFRKEDHDFADLTLPASIGAPDRSLYAIGRDRDITALEHLGRVDLIARGPAVRFDRTYRLFRVASDPTSIEPDIPLVESNRDASRR